MLQYYPSEERFTADHGWLLTRHSFSFADYYDPHNISFGSLRVFNDDIVQPGKGFGMHSHREMEIISYVVEGTLEHRDSLGNTGYIHAGELQRMTAGTGIMHAEYNPSDSKQVHFFQIWILPREKALAPSWEQKRFTLEEQKNTLLPVVSGARIPNTLHIHQNANFYLSSLENNVELTHQGHASMKYFLFCIKGSVRINDQITLREGDSARITDTAGIQFKSLGNAAQFLLIEMA